MEDLESMMATHVPTAERPLAGLTVLMVEDSRFACEAMRLLCLRSGARIRRADCLSSARRHLQVYRPSVIIVDLGLPDGSGEDLISELTQAQPKLNVILGTSGDPDGEEHAMAAGADGFLAKPIDSLAAFQNLVLSFLPADRRPTGPRKVETARIVPDRIAFCDDLAHIAQVLSSGADEKTLDYVTQFLGGLARSAHDQDLEEAALSLAEVREEGLPIRSNISRLAGIVHERLAAGGTL